MICVGVPFLLGLRLEDGHVPTFWLLLYMNMGARVKIAHKPDSGHVSFAPEVVCCQNCSSLRWLPFSSP